MTQNIESSLAFLQIQKSSNLKRDGARNDDVFRIFRRTGQHIALIAQQIERERCSYLKNSYTEKNQLYKEFAAVIGINRKVNVINGDGVVDDPLVSDAENEQRRRKRKEDIRRINVNVLKRCECCRRLAFRIKENKEVEDHDDHEAGELVEDEKENESATKEEQAAKKKELQEHGVENTKEGTDEKNIKVLGAGNLTTTNASKQQKHPEMVSVQFSRSTQDVRFQTSPRAPGMVVEPKRHVQVQSQNSPRSNTLSSVGTVSLGAPGPVKSERPFSPGCSGSRGIGTRSTSLRKSTSPWVKVNIKALPSGPVDKLKLQGQAWKEHVRTLQTKNKVCEGTPTAGLPEAYEAFRKLVREMEETEKEKEKERDLLREMDNCQEDRPMSTASRRLSATGLRWQPLRRTSVCPEAAISQNTFRPSSHATDPVSLDDWSEKSEVDRLEGEQKYEDSFPEEIGIFITEH